MENFKYAPNIKVGDLFTRVDRNGKVWTAKVINRTEHYVDVEKTRPYQVRFADDGVLGEMGYSHYEDAPITYERAEIIQQERRVETGKMIKCLFGEVDTIKETKLQKFENYFIKIRDVYDKYNGKYDKTFAWEGNEDE